MFLSCFVLFKFCRVNVVFSEGVFCVLFFCLFVFGVFVVRCCLFLLNFSGVFGALVATLLSSIECIVLMIFCFMILWNVCIEFVRSFIVFFVLLFLSLWLYVLNVVVTVLLSWSFAALRIVLFSVVFWILCKILVVVSFLSVVVNVFCIEIFLVFFNELRCCKVLIFEGGLDVRTCTKDIVIVVDEWTFVFWFVKVFVRICWVVLEFIFFFEVFDDVREIVRLRVVSFVIWLFLIVSSSSRAFGFFFAIEVYG